MGRADKIIKIFKIINDPRITWDMENVASPVYVCNHDFDKGRFALHFHVKALLQHPKKNKEKLIHDIFLWEIEKIDRISDKFRIWYQQIEELDKSIDDCFHAIEIGDDEQIR